MSKVKAAIIGGGSVAGYHVGGFRRAGAEILAVADVNAASAERFAVGYGIPKWYTDPEKMLADLPELDAVSIAVPNYLHHPLAMKCLEAGRHVYCEKPPALNAAQVLEMKTTAEKNGRVLMFDFNNRARTEAQALKQYIKEGVLGKINSVQAIWIRRNGIPGFGGWFTQKEKSGGGPVIDLLHMLDLGLYFMDYPEPAYLLAAAFDEFMGDPRFKGPWGVTDRDNPMDVETACHAFITFKSGQCLSLRNSWAEMNEREVVSVTLQGTKAGARIQRLFRTDGLDETSEDLCELYTVENGLQVNRTLVIPEDPSMGRLESAANFIRVIEGRETGLNSPDQAVSLMRIIDAVYQSAGSGRPVSFDGKDGMP